MTGIDVSYHQGSIDWKKVKAAGVDFVIIRAGYGTQTRDRRFIEYITGATTAGIKHIGVYWFIYAQTELEARANAIACNSVIELYRNVIDMKVWADWEYDSDQRAGSMSNSARSNIVSTWLKTMQGYGWDVGLYANPDYLDHKFTDSLKQWPLWLARYSSAPGRSCYMWQHSSRGTVPGISGMVDLDVLYGAVDEVADGSIYVLSVADCWTREEAEAQDLKLRAAGIVAGVIHKVKIIE